MYKLMVSYNCGCSYSVAAEAETAEELFVEADEFTEKGLRWTIEEDGGKSVAFTPIFQEIIDSFKE